MMKEYNRFKDLFNDIRQIKGYVIKLKGQKLGEYCDYFYSLPFQEWRLDVLWEYIWGDRTYANICKVFKMNIKEGGLCETDESNGFRNN